MANKRTVAKNTGAKDTSVSTPVVNRTTSRAKHAPATVATAVAEVIEVKTPYVPSHEEISTLAYSYYVACGYRGGSQEADWLRAETELGNRAV